MRRAANHKHQSKGTHRHRVEKRGRKEKQAWKDQDYDK